MTVFARFVDEFPDREETRILVLQDKITGQERGRLYLDERYCADPECDCQRAMLYVHDEATRLLAAITWDFRGPARTPEGANPFLEPGVSQPRGAEVALGYVEWVIDGDLAYRARLRAHYAELKERTRDPAHPLWPAILKDRRMMTRLAERMAAKLLGPAPPGPDQSRREKNRAKRRQGRAKRR
jgi:hypothetical protein